MNKLNLPFIIEIINSLKEETKLTAMYLSELLLFILMQLLDMPNIYALATSSLFTCDGFSNFINVDTHEKISIEESNALIDHLEKFFNYESEPICQYSRVYLAIKSKFLWSCFIVGWFKKVQLKLFVIFCKYYLWKSGGHIVVNIHSQCSHDW